MKPPGYIKGRGRRPSLVAVLVIAGVVGWAATSAAQAYAAGPGWAVWATSAPTAMRTGIDEIQEVSVIPGEPTFRLEYRGQATAALPSITGAAEVQAALEGLASIGAGNVRVAGGPPGAYRVTFVGLLGGIKTAELSAEGATIGVPTEGAAGGTIAINLFNVGAEASHGVVTVSDAIPAGFVAKEAGALVKLSDRTGPEDYGIDPVFQQSGWSCRGNGPQGGVDGASEVSCESSLSFQGGGGIPTLGSLFFFNNPGPILGISVTPEAESERGENKVVVAGGGAPGAAANTDTLLASPEPPAHGVAQADAWFSNADGTIDLQAGSHPYTATFTFAAAVGMGSDRKAFVAGGDIRNLESLLPAGLVGDLSKVQQCTRRQLESERCPPGSMVGALGAQAFLLPIEAQVFNMQPEPGTPVELGFVYGGVDVFVTFSVRNREDSAVTAHINNIPARDAFQTILTLWGNPAERSHDWWRGFEGGCSQEEIEHPALGEHVEAAEFYCAEPLGLPEKPILSLPTRCGEAQPVTLRESGSWPDPFSRSQVSFFTHDADGAPAGFTGCEQLRFEPFAGLSAGTAEADAAGEPIGELSGGIGNLEDPDGLSPATVKSFKMELPKGFTLNPERATGLKFCGAAESGQAENVEDEAATCPEASKLASVEVKTPILEDAPEPVVTGGLYLLESDPPDVKVLLAASGDGINLKLPGTVRLDPSSGAVTAEFPDTPPIPFSRARLAFSGGVAAPLITPAHCGTYESRSAFESWSGQSTTQAIPLEVSVGTGGGGCAQGTLPFRPTLEAGASNGVAGASMRETVTVRRADGEQRLNDLRLSMPLGLTGMLSQVTQCGEAAAQQGTCPASSGIGHVRVAAGPGSQPFVLPQPGGPEAPIYLTGPYHGAPFGLSIVTPIVAGPFDLGKIVTRAKIEVDPITARVSVATDALPQIVDGVPTNVRWVEAVIDRKGFLLNPTNCTAQEMTGVADSTAPVGGPAEPGVAAALSTPFDISACRALAFRPKLALKLNGGTKRNKNPALTATVTYPKGGQYANIASAQVTLPHSEFLDQSHIGTVCTRVQFAAHACPPASVYGKAIAYTPLLDQPLSGPVYLRSSSNKLPDLVADLNGQIEVALDGKVDTGKGGGIRNTFQMVPDAPVSKFVLSLQGGKQGLLVNSENICKKPQHAIADFTGQNGKISDTTPKVQNSCPKKGPKGGKGHHHHHSHRVGTSHR